MSGMSGRWICLWADASPSSRVWVRRRDSAYARDVVGADVAVRQVVSRVDVAALVIQHQLQQRPALTHRQRRHTASRSFSITLVQPRRALCDNDDTPHHAHRASRSSSRDPPCMTHRQHTAASHHARYETSSYCPTPTVITIINSLALPA